MIQVGIVGGAGYVAGELIRLLLGHPKVGLRFVQSDSQSGPVAEVHRDLVGETDLVFHPDFNDKDVDLIFLCKGHGKSRLFLESNPLRPDLKVIDLSTDFRHAEKSQFQGRQFVYGLPELNRTHIANTDSVANPGCFASAIELALIPLTRVQNVTSVHVNAITGSTGAGQGLSDTTHFSWRNNNISSYKVFTHQHEKEIKQVLGFSENGPGPANGFFFVPVRGNFTRGIFCTAYTQSQMSLHDLADVYRDFYIDSSFVKISDKPLDLKQVVNTNKCLIQLQKHGDTVLITSVLDNLLKGASGQAVQNMNLMMGLSEDQGLQLKAAYF